MKLKHTQGEWVLEETSKTRFTIHSKTIEGNTGFTQPIASTFYSDESEANAKLIAAAPKMLDALINISSQLKDKESKETMTTTWIDEVIKLATGE